MEAIVLWTKIDSVWSNLFPLTFSNTLERSSYALASNLSKLGLQVHWAKRPAIEPGENEV